VELQSLCHPAVRKVATAGEVVLVGFGDQRRARAVA
jgi:hypothetical protein